MSNSSDSKPQVEPEAGFSQVGHAHDLDEKAKVDHAYDLDDKAKVADYKADAVAAENAEHNMTVLEAVRAYPMASFWAFVMSFTIVSSLTRSPAKRRTRS